MSVAACEQGVQGGDVGFEGGGREGGSKGGLNSFFA